MIKNIMWVVTGFILAVILIGIYKFNYLANQTGYDIDGNKIEVYSFEECNDAGYEIIESYPERCSDGKKVFTKNILEKKDGKVIPIEGNNGIGNGDHSDFINFLEDKKKLEKIYKDIPVLEENEFEIEVSRSLKDCFFQSPRQCLQVKKENSNWELFYDSILGFNYIEGDYYILKIREIKYDMSASNLPEDISPIIWELKEVLKHIPGVKKVGGSEKMVIKIPSVDFNEEGRIITKFTEYKVSKTKGILKSTLNKLFELRNNNGKWNGLEFDSVSIENKKALLNLKGSWYPAGDMSGFYFREEIEAAAKQFSTVKDIKVFVNGKVFDWCIDDMSDGESGCNEKPKFWDTTLLKDI